MENFGTLMANKCAGRAPSSAAHARAVGRSPRRRCSELPFTSTVDFEQGLTIEFLPGAIASLKAKVSEPAAAAFCVESTRSARAQPGSPTVTASA